MVGRDFLTGREKDDMRRISKASINNVLIDIMTKDDVTCNLLIFFNGHEWQSRTFRILYSSKSKPKRCPKIARRF